MQKGFTEVYRFTGGIPEWRYFNYPMITSRDWSRIKVAKISPDSFADLTAGNAYLILDVRPLEFARNNSFIDGAVHCPLVYLDRCCRDIPVDCEILLTDWAMISATNAAKFLTSRGYSVKGVLKGGIERWIAEKRPVEVRPTNSVPFTFSWDYKLTDCR